MNKRVISMYTKGFFFKSDLDKSGEENTMNEFDIP